MNISLMQDEYKPQRLFRNNRNLRIFEANPKFRSIAMRKCAFPATILILLSLLMMSCGPSKHDIKLQNNARRIKELDSLYTLNQAKIERILALSEEILQRESDSSQVVLEPMALDSISYLVLGVLSSRDQFPFQPDTLPETFLPNKDSLLPLCLQIPIEKGANSSFEDQILADPYGWNALNEYRNGFGWPKILRDSTEEFYDFQCRGPFEDCKEAILNASDMHHILVFSPRYFKKPKDASLFIPGKIFGVLRAYNIQNGRAEGKAWLYATNSDQVYGFSFDGQEIDMQEKLEENLDRNLKDNLEKGLKALMK